MVIFYYGGAPLESIANPQQTPLDTKAPWYFWWLQGLLKLGDKFIMGVVIPGLLVGLLIAIPYIDRNPSRSFVKRPIAVGLGVLFVLVLILLSYMGLPQYGIETPAATRIVQDMSPEEGHGPLNLVAYDQLQPGVYIADESQTENLCPEIDFGCPELERFFSLYTSRVSEGIESGDLPNGEGTRAFTSSNASGPGMTRRLGRENPTNGISTSTAILVGNNFPHQPGG